MQMYPLRPSKNSISHPGDFAAKVTADAIELPPELCRAAKKLTITNAAELVSFLFTFPTAFASEVDWSVDELTRARDGIVKQLEGRLPAALLQTPLPVARIYGAFPPVGHDSPRL